MEEIPPIHIQSAAAELPVGAQKIMKFEDFVLVFIQRSFGDETKIGNIFLVFSPPDHAPVATPDLFQTNAADVFFFRRAVTELGVARLKYAPQDAVAGRLRSFPAASTQSETQTLRARLLRQREDF
jgi:hypothetical protein